MTLAIAAAVVCAPLVAPPAEPIWRARLAEAVPYDGDTFKARVLLWDAPEQTITLRVRIKGIDAPEIKGKCDEEKALALKARDALGKLLEGDPVWLSYVTEDPYQGRVDACVYDSYGASIGGRLLDMGLAKPAGKTRVGGWCP